MPRSESHATIEGGHLFTLKEMSSEQRIGKIKNAGTLRETKPHVHPKAGERIHIETHIAPGDDWRTIVDLRQLSHTYRRIRQKNRDR